MSKILPMDSETVDGLLELAQRKSKSEFTLESKSQTHYSCNTTYLLDYTEYSFPLIGGFICRFHKNDFISGDVVTEAYVVKVESPAVSFEYYTYSSDTHYADITSIIRYIHRKDKEEPPQELIELKELIKLAISKEQS